MVDLSHLPEVALLLVGVLFGLLLDGILDLHGVWLVLLLSRRVSHLLRLAVAVACGYLGVGCGLGLDALDGLGVDQREGLLAVLRGRLLEVSQLLGVVHHLGHHLDLVVVESLFLGDLRQSRMPVETNVHETNALLSSLDEGVMALI